MFQYNKPIPKKGSQGNACTNLSYIIVKYICRVGLPGNVCAQEVTKEHINKQN